MQQYAVADFDVRESFLVWPEDLDLYDACGCDGGVGDVEAEVVVAWAVFGALGFRGRGGRDGDDVEAFAQVVAEHFERREVAEVGAEGFCETGTEGGFG